jgi:hypothetical protein
MVQEYNNQFDLDPVVLNGNESIKQNLIEVTEISSTNPQVKATSAPNRKFTAQYKQQILIAFDACKNPLERGELLRREALYSTHISSWRRLFKPDNENKKEASKAQRMDQLVNEIEQLKKKLAHAQAIIDLQKKVSELLGTYILPHESKGEKS